jgi:uncharacterized repeat protein (TIGR01451 family)
MLLQASISITSAQDETQWEVYQNSEYDFSVEYPINWSIDIIPTQTEENFSKREMIIRFSKDPFSSIHIDIINTFDDVEKWFVEYELPTKGTPIEPQKDLRINGINAIYYFFPGDISNHLLPRHVSILKHEEYIFRIEYLVADDNDYLAIYKRILGSLIFDNNNYGNTILFHEDFSPIQYSFPDLSINETRAVASLPCSVTRFSQNDPAFQPELYTASCLGSSTMAQGGCAITSLAMMLKYYGVDTNPRILDDTLGVAGCPLSSHWNDVATIGGAGSDVSWVGAWDGAQWSMLEADLADGEPVVVRYYRSSDSKNHYVLAVSGSGSSYSNYTIADSWDGTLKSMASYYNRGYYFAGLIRYTGTPHCLQDTTPPNNPTSINPGCTANNGEWQNTCNNTNFSWSGASDSGSGVAGYQYYWGTSSSGTSTSFTTSTSYNPGAVGEGTRYFRIRTKDNAGNYAAWKTMFVLRYDGTAPTGSLSINNGNATTYKTLVTLDPTANDNLSGARYIRFRDQGGAWGDWQGIMNTNWVLPAVTGQTYTVEAEVKDAAGNVSTVIMDDIVLNIYPDRPSSSNFTLVNSTFGMSATTSTSSEFTLNGTLSQPSMIGDHQSGSYQLASGYWSLLFEDPEADLSLTKTASAGPIYTGDSFTYTLEVENLGEDPAEQVVVTDDLPDDVTFISASGNGWDCNQNAGMVTCTRESLAVGTAADIVIEVTASNAGTIQNTASVTSETLDNNGANNSDSADVTVIPLADLAITKAASPSPVAVGETLTYTLSVENLGPDMANDLVLVDTLPDSVSFVSVAGTGWICNEASKTVTCERDTLGVGTAFDITIEVTAPMGTGEISNTASVSSATADNNPINDTDTASVTVQPHQADLAITKTGSPSPVVMGETLTYTLFVQNLGPDIANYVEVVDTLPSGVTFVSAGGTGWDCEENSGTVTCTLDSLGGGSIAADITIVVTAPSSIGNIANTVTVSSSTQDGDMSNNERTCNVNVVEEQIWHLNYLPLIIR